MDELISSLKKHVNLNSVLLIVLIGLLKWEAGRLYARLDNIETGYIDVVQRLARVEAVNGLTTPTAKPNTKP
jgi:hypothetical protein